MTQKLKLLKVCHNICMQPSDSWHKQSSEKPLFPDLLWSRPESKQARGKLLIIGGNSFGFGAVGEAYNQAIEAGAGTVRILLPLAVKKVAGGVLPDVEFGASTPSGSFGKSALGEWLAHAEWADGVLLAGDLGRNSETAILLEDFLAKYSGQITLAKDTADYCLARPELVLNRPQTLLVISMSQLQKIAMAARFDIAFRLDMDLVQLVNGLHEFTLRYGVQMIVKHHTQLVVAVAGQISTTATDEQEDIWRTKTAASASVWWLQNPSKPFEALTTAMMESDQRLPQ